MGAGDIADTVPARVAAEPTMRVGARLTLQAVATTVSGGRRRVLLASLLVVAVLFVVAMVIGLIRALAGPVATVAVLLGLAAVLAVLVTGAELLWWMFADRRRVSDVPIDQERFAAVAEAVERGELAQVDPADRRALARFARVQRVALPAVAVLDAFGVVVSVALLVVALMSSSVGLVIGVVVAVLVGGWSLWSLRGVLRALGETPVFAALGD